MNKSNRQVTEVGTPGTPMSDLSPTTLMPAPRLLVPGANGERGEGGSVWMPESRWKMREDGDWWEIKYIMIHHESFRIHCFSSEMEILRSVGFSIQGLKEFLDHLVEWSMTSWDQTCSDKSSFKQQHWVGHGKSLVWWLVVLRHRVGTLVEGNLGAPVVPTGMFEKKITYRMICRSHV